VRKSQNGVLAFTKIYHSFFEEFFFGYLQNKSQGIFNAKYRSLLQITNLAYFGILLVSIRHITERLISDSKDESPIFSEVIFQ
jgi:hypothetical protein